MGGDWAQRVTKQIQHFRSILLQLFKSLKSYLEVGSLMSFPMFLKFTHDISVDIYSDIHIIKKRGGGVVFIFIYEYTYIFCD